MKSTVRGIRLPATVPGAIIFSDRPTFMLKPYETAEDHHGEYTAPGRAGEPVTSVQAPGETGAEMPQIDPPGIPQIEPPGTPEIPEPDTPQIEPPGTPEIPAPVPEIPEVPREP